MRFLLILFCFYILIPHRAQSQTDSVVVKPKLLYSSTPCKIKRVPYFKSRDVATLTAYLTKNLRTDDEKICAIYTWVITHIKYNYNKAAIGDYSKNNLRSILKKRRAICQGYSDLINAMCKEAGISSVGVPGYVKTYNTDLADSFYVSEHIWNAVYLDGEWKLLDATWDAGYVKVVGKTFWGTVKWIFTLGYLPPYRYKPRFVRVPRYNYFLKSGYYFSADHLASVPYWQLLAPPMTIDSFEHDSADYLHYRKIEFAEYDYANEGKRNAFSTLSDEDQIIKIGMDAHKFGYINHFDIGVSYSYLLKREIEDFEPEGDSLTELKKARAAIKFGDSGMIFYDSAGADFKLQKMQLMRKARLKRNLAMQVDKEIIRTAKRNKKLLDKKITRIHQIKKETNKALHADLKWARYTYSEGFEKKKWAQSRNHPDRQKKADTQIRLAHDSISILKQHMFDDWRVPNLTKTFRDSLQHFYTNAVYTSLFMGGVITLRIFSQDNLDHYMKLQRDTLLKYNALCKQGLLINNITLSDSMRRLFKEKMRAFHVIHRLYRNQMRGFKNYKGAIAADDGITARYAAFKMEYDSFIVYERNFVKGWIMALHHLDTGTQVYVRKYLHRIKRRGYYDIYLTKYLSKGENSQNRHHYNGIRHQLLVNRKIVRRGWIKSNKYYKRITRKKPK